MITLTELIMFTTMLIALVSLCYQIFKDSNKKQ